MLVHSAILTSNVHRCICTCVALAQQNLIPDQRMPGSSTVLNGQQQQPPQYSTPALDPQEGLPPTSTLVGTTCAVMVASNRPSSVTLEPHSKFWIHTPFYQLPLLTPRGEGGSIWPVVFATLVTQACNEVGLQPSLAFNESAQGRANLKDSSIGVSLRGAERAEQDSIEILARATSGTARVISAEASPATAPAGGWLAFAP